MLFSVAVNSDANQRQHTITQTNNTTDARKRVFLFIAPRVRADCISFNHIVQSLETVHAALFV